MMHGMGRLYMLLFALEILLVALALISCLSAEDGEVRALPRYIWVIVILLFPLVGSIVYFVVGRPVKGTPRTSRPVGGGFPESGRPRRAPDDDPEFLRQLDEQARKQDEEMLRRWEADLRQREDKLRRDDGTPPEARPEP
jgi:hypothetical protein